MRRTYDRTPSSEQGIVRSILFVRSQVLRECLHRYSKLTNAITENQFLRGTKNKDECNFALPQSFVLTASLNVTVTDKSRLQVLTCAYRSYRRFKTSNHHITVSTVFTVSKITLETKC